MPLAIVFALLLIGGLFLPAESPARRATAGLAAFLLGWASFRVGLPEFTWTATLGDVMAQSEPSGFLVVSLGLLLVGPIGLLGGAWPAWRRGGDGGRRWGLAAVVIGVVALVAEWRAFLILRPAPPLFIAGAIGGAGLTAVYAARVFGLGDRCRRLDDRFPGAGRRPGPADEWRRRDGILTLAVAAAAATVFLGTGPMVVGSAALLGAVALDLVGMRLARRRRFPYLALAGGIVLVAAWWAQGSMEIQWEFALSGCLLLALWPIAALMPWHRWGEPELGAPLAAVILAQLGVNSFLSGVLYWQPVIFPVCLASAWWAAATGRSGLLTGAVALAAVATGERAGLVGAALLLTGGVLPWADAARGGDRLVPSTRWASAPLAWTGLAIALPGLLRAEVVYSVLLVAAAAAGLGLSWAGLGRERIV